MQQNAIYGIGGFGRAFYKAMCDDNVQVDCFIDEYTSTSELFGKPVYKIRDLKDKNIKIYISVTTHTHKIDETLRCAGFHDIIGFVDTFTQFPKALIACLVHCKMWYSRSEDMLDMTKINELKNLLSDSFSVNLLENIVKFRKETSPQNYIIPQNVEMQYFPEDIELFTTIEKLRLIDGGAFTGDSIPFAIQALQKLNKSVEYVISFEPDLANIPALNREQIAQQQNLPSARFLTYNSALWSENTILIFQANQGSASSVGANDSNGVSITAVTIDSTLIAAAPNYIKMDIEGAEKDALLGAAGTIKKYTPCLAICVYHKPSDLWEIPLLINSINPNYNMYLRVYGHLGLETVIYCVPK